MCTLVRAFLPLVLACFGGHLQDGQTKKPDHQRTASVSGRVTIGDDPAVGVQVVLASESMQDEESEKRAKTDQNGRYLLDSLASGYYTIGVLSLTMAVQGKGNHERRISLGEAARLENIDFALVPGGVITGRVTDGDGSPITDQFPRLKLVDEKGQSTMFWPSRQESETDDRGIYRIYGLPPGRYIIGFGVEGGSTHEQTEFVAPSQLYPLTYYPGVLDETAAKTIEVAAGSEITGIDISLTAKKSLFKASGTVVDADTGAPIAGAVLHHAGGGLSPFADQRTVPSDPDGRFKLDRLQTGKHSLTLASDYSEATDRVADQVTFELTDGDVDGLEVKVHHGLSISGVVVSANPSDQAIASEPASRDVYAVPERTPNPDRVTWVNNYRATIAADGSFRMAGLAPGKYRLGLSWDGADGSYISYIDVPGVGRLTNTAPYPPGSFEGDPIEIGEGQNNQDIRGVRIALGRANGVIRGQLKFEGGPLPQDAMMAVSIVLLPASDTRQNGGARVDPDGRFVIRALVAGQYLISAAAYIYPPPNQGGSGMKVLARASETLSISDGQEINVTLTLNLGPGQ